MIVLVSITELKVYSARNIIISEVCRQSDVVVRSLFEGESLLMRSGIEGDGDFDCA